MCIGRAYYGYIYISVMFMILTLSLKVSFYTTTRYYTLGLGRPTNGPTQIYCGNPSCEKFISLREANLAFSPHGWPQIRPWAQPDFMDLGSDEALEEFLIADHFYTRRRSSSRAQLGMYNIRENGPFLQALTLYELGRA